MRHTSMRACAALCVSVFAVVVLTGCGSRSDSGATDVKRQDARKYVLTPGDLGRGYTSGDDSGCGGISPEESSEEFTSFVLDTRPAGCFEEINYIWGGARAKVVPRSVESAAIVFDNDQDARRGMALRNELIEFAVAESPRDFADLPDFGHEAVRFRNGGYDVPPGAGVFWRNGNLLSVVFAGGIGLTDESAPGVALELARKQQARIESPRPAPVETGTDPELPLDDPQLDATVYWLGRRFEPDGGLPPLDLARSHGGDAPPELGWTVEMDYGGSEPLSGVKIWVFSPPAFERFKNGVLGRLVAAAPCSESTKRKVPGGHAEIWKGYAKPQGKPCPDRPYDRYVAYVYLADAVVAINQPWCLYPCSAPVRGNPYNTERGVAAIATSLRVRKPRTD